MVSRANYVAITIIMMIVLLLFQFTGVSENVVLRDGKNLSVDAAVSEEKEAVQKERYEKAVAELTEMDGMAEIGLVGSEEACSKVGQEWCRNQKKTYRFYNSLQEAAKDPNCSKVLLTDGKRLENEEALEAIEELGKRNRSVIVSGLPDLNQVRKYPNILKSLGIQKILDDSLELEGFRLFSGFILGGETVYDDYQQTLPYVKLDESVQVYAVGQSDAEEWKQVKNEELPALIWRNYNFEGNVYVVNGDFLQEKPGAGILTGIAADMASRYLYPVVNAQVSAMINYPMLSEENKEVMEREYGQKSTAMVRDVLWPVIARIYYDTDERMTALIAPRLDYQGDGELNESLINYFYKQVTKMRGELGLSGEQKSAVSLEEKLGQDLEILKKNLPNYEMRIFYAGDMQEKEYEPFLKDGEALEDIHTILRDYSDRTEEPMFSFAEGNALELMLYMDHSAYSSEDDFRLRCFQTAYGYYAGKVDMARAIYPETEQDLWNELSENWAKYYRPYRERFRYFDKLTATAADTRVRNYLALQYDVTEREDTLVLDVESEESQNYFILKTHGERIKKISGADCQELEKDWYLLKTESPQITIQLEQTDRSVYD